MTFVIGSPCPPQLPRSFQLAALIKLANTTKVNLLGEYGSHQPSWTWSTFSSFPSPRFIILKKVRTDKKLESTPTVLREGAGIWNIRLTLIAPLCLPFFLCSKEGGSGVTPKTKILRVIDDHAYERAFTTIFHFPVPPRSHIMVRF